MLINAMCVEQIHLMLSLDKHTATHMRTQESWRRARLWTCVMKKEINCMGIGAELQEGWSVCGVRHGLRVATYGIFIYSTSSPTIHAPPHAHTHFF